MKLNNKKIKEYITNKVNEEINKVKKKIDERSEIANSIDTKINQRVYSVLGDIILTLKNQKYTDEQIKEYIKDKFSNDFAIDKMLKGINRTQN